MAGEREREIAERVARASPGPWYARSQPDEPLGESETHISTTPTGLVTEGNSVGLFGVSDGSSPQEIADATFCAHAREDIPYLLAALREAREEGERLESIVVDQQAALKRLETANDRLIVQHAERGKVNADLNKRVQRAERELAEAREARDAARAALREILVFGKHIGGAIRECPLCQRRSPTDEPAVHYSGCRYDEFAALTPPPGGADA